MSRFIPRGDYDPIAVYRDADRRLRAMARNGGRTAATTSACQDYWDVQQHVLVSFDWDDEVERYIVALLTDETRLSRRLLKTPDRPELKTRLRDTQKELRRLAREGGWRENWKARNVGPDNPISRYRKAHPKNIVWSPERGWH